MSEARVTRAQARKRARSPQPESTRTKRKPRAGQKKAAEKIPSMNTSLDSTTSACTNRDDDTTNTAAASTNETSGEKNKVRQRKALNKSAKANVIHQVKIFNNATLSALAIMGVCSQLPLSNEHLKVFCEGLPVNDVEFFTEHLKGRFVTLYEECATISDRYLKFQLKWHHHCSYFLVDCNRDLSLIGLHPSDPIAVDVVSVRSQWSRLAVQYSLQKEESKTFLTLYCGNVYNELLHRCHSVIETSSQPDVQSTSVDSDDVYYRFGGAGISSMLHSRYARIKVCALPDKQQLSLEISVLQKLSIHQKEEKGDIPSYLKYRDNGNMYFPCVELIPFLKAVDAATKENCNDTSFRRCGSELLTTLPSTVENNANLRSIFINAVVIKISELKDASFACFDKVFRELARKVCHTRVQEYLDSFKQSVAASKGSGTLAGQNLRDSLLSNHVHLKSKIK